VKPHEFDRIVQKFRMTTRQGRDLLAWFEYDGRVITRTRRSKGSGDLPFRLIRKQLELNEQQFRDAINCSLERDGYITILREKGLIAPTS
jgi:hypothetical protein